MHIDGADTESVFARAVVQPLPVSSDHVAEVESVMSTAKNSSPDSPGVPLVVLGDVPEAFCCAVTALSLNQLVAAPVTSNTSQTTLLAAPPPHATVTVPAESAVAAVA